ncbi:pilus assembly protein [Comamonas thiooxydans]|nr:PilC/PilY family type IV pilus protein [Comamonas thiooxydans]
MPRTKHFHFQKKLLSIAIGVALTPSTTLALNLVQEPPLPTSKSAFVAPNVIISIDDSGSMAYRVTPDSSGNYKNSSTSTGAGYTYPDTAGNWKNDAQRINVLKYSLKSIFEKNAKFDDEELIPKNKIRIAWQAMHNNGKSSGADTVNSSTLKTNSMRPIDATVSTTTHRDNFLDFVSKLHPQSGTPSHTMFSQADAYMRLKTSPTGPWSTDPGGTGSKKDEYLGCRRNYHIMMTDGVWNGTVSGGDQDGIDWGELNGRKAYNSASDQTRIYFDSYKNTLSDWAFKSWMDPLQDPSKLSNSESLKPSKLYEEAPSTEKFAATKNIELFENITKSQCSEKSGEWVKVNGKNRCKTITTETKSINLEKYWNPKYNPATWPHMVTYTIGFSNEAVDLPFNPSNIEYPTERVPFGYDKSFIDFITGWSKWPDINTLSGGADANKNDRAIDLWHAAINGRGRFYAVTKSEDLAKAFKEIIGKINEESAPLPDKIAGGGSTSGYNVSQNNAGIYASAYSPKDGWSGYITATRALEPETYACPSKEDPEKTCIRFPDVISGWEGKSTADRLDALMPTDGQPDGRLVLSWSNETNAGIPFKWNTTANPPAYSTAQIRALIGSTLTGSLTDSEKSQGQKIVNYIRGDRSLEGTTDAKPLRVRTSRQGDIVNSEIWYTGGPVSNYAMGYSSFVTAQKNREPVLYVGGNDGMLHGFSAKNGSELLAYVPRGVVGGLKSLTDKDYQHQYYVDGSPMTGDIKDGDNWKTMLVGSLGAGGKGYFLLDVTNPGTFTASSVIKDRTRSNSEAASGEDADIGNITARPGRNPANLQETTQITRLNNGRWAVVMGNGYNSTNQRPVLLVQYLDGNKELVRIQTTDATTGQDNAADNGLASPALVDLDGNGTTDVVYAGDNLGNLWKFDLTSTSASSWAVAFGKDKPLFTARGPVTLSSNARDQVQPITAPPIVRANDRSMTIGTGKDAKTLPVGGLMVAFGTGRNLTANDRNTSITQNVQTLYSVLDNTRYRMNSDKNSLEVHPGAGTCPSGSDCVPKPTPVGTMNSTGKLLAKQSISQLSGATNDDAIVTANDNLTSENWKDFKGWYLDLPATGERLLKPMQFFDGSNILAVYSESPSGTKNAESDNINESCVPVKVDTSAGAQWRTLINIMDGKRPTIQLFDTNGDGFYNSADGNVSRTAVKTGTPLLITKRDRIADLTGGGGARDTLARMPEQSTRPSWRQIK